MRVIDILQMERKMELDKRRSEWLKQEGNPEKLTKEEIEVILGKAQEEYPGLDLESGYDPENPKFQPMVSDWLVRNTDITKSFCNYPNLIKEGHPTFRSWIKDTDSTFLDERRLRAIAKNLIGAGTRGRSQIGILEYLSAVINVTPSYIDYNNYIEQAQPISKVVNRGVCITVQGDRNPDAIIGTMYFHDNPNKDYLGKGIEFMDKILARLSDIKVISDKDKEYLSNLTGVDKYFALLLTAIARDGHGLELVIRLAQDISFEKACSGDITKIERAIIQNICRAESVVGTEGKLVKPTADYVNLLESLISSLQDEELVLVAKNMLRVHLEFLVSPSRIYRNNRPSYVAHAFTEKAHGLGIFPKVNRGLMW